jgi:AraC-like DNA-binding protein
MTLTPIEYLIIGDRSYFAAAFRKKFGTIPAPSNASTAKKFRLAISAIAED